MKGTVFSLSMVLMLSGAFCLSAAADSSTAQAETLDLINKDLNKYRIRQDSAYLEMKNNRLQTIIGQQNSISDNDFIADTGGICGVSTAFKTDRNSVNLLYGNDGQNIFAANITTALKPAHNTSLTALYFKAKTSYVGFKVSGQLAKNLVFTAETSENLTDLSKGYLLTAKYKDSEHEPFDIAISYRDVQATAISDYSAASALADSQGIRVETNYKLAPDLTLTAFEDFAKAQDKTSKKARQIMLTWRF
jgi:hypothetical protein